jgi:hypothetical protein
VPEAEAAPAEEAEPSAGAEAPAEEADAAEGGDSGTQ